MTEQLLIGNSCRAFGHFNNIKSNIYFSCKDGNYYLEMYYIEMFFYFSTIKTHILSYLSKTYFIGRVLVILDPYRKKVKLLSHVWLFVTPWTVAQQASPSMGFSRHEYWSGLTFPSPGRSSQPRDWTQVSRIVGSRFTIWATREVLYYCVIFVMKILLWMDHRRIYAFSVISIMINSTDLGNGSSNL